MQTIAEWYNQQKSRREAERQKQDRLMSTYFQQKAKLGENKLANDKTVSFVKERLKSSLGEDYGKFEEQLSEKLNLPKLKEQYPYSYGEKYSLLVDDMLKKYQTGESIEQIKRNIVDIFDEEALSEIEEEIGEDATLADYKREKSQLVAEKEALQQRQKDKEKVSNDIKAKIGISKFNELGLQNKSLEYLKQFESQRKFKTEEGGGVSKPIKSGGVTYKNEQEVFNDIRTGKYTKEQIRLKIRDLETSGTEVEDDTEDELMTYASDYDWTGDFPEKLRVSGIPYLKNLDSADLTKAKRLEEMEGIGGYISGLSNALKSAPEQKKKQLINRHKTIFMQGEDDNFYYVAPEAQGEIKQHRELQAEKDKLEEEKESLDVPERSGLFGWKGYKDLTSEQQKALDRSKEIDQEINKIEDKMSESRKKLEENREQIPEQFNQGFLALENEILNLEMQTEPDKTEETLTEERKNEILKSLEL